MEAQWSVMPRTQPLPSGEVMLMGGRPGIFLWIGGRNMGRQWQSINICDHHNQGVATLRKQGIAHAQWAFEEALTTLTPTSAMDNQQRTCCPHPNCTRNGAWCQSTAYTSLIQLGEHGTEYVLLYDRLSNGWGGPPGEWGEHDRVFSMRFRLTTMDVESGFD
jgi:hypothetical protein